MTAKLFQRCRNGWMQIAALPAIVLVPLAIVATSAVVTGGLLSVRQVGGLQPLELTTYDLMVRLRSDRAADPRLLLVAITEADIKAQKRWPLSDLTIATALQKLQRFHPSDIGLDIYRDLPQPPGTAALAQQLQQANVVAITKVQDADDLGVAPPLGVPDDCSNARWHLHGADRGRQFGRERPTGIRCHWRQCEYRVSVRKLRERPANRSLPDSHCQRYSRAFAAKDTLVHLRDKFAVEPWGPLALKGKQQLIDVYRVLGYANNQRV